MFVINATKIENGVTCLTVVPHVCDICKKAFLLESTLYEHIQTHQDRSSIKADSNCPLEKTSAILNLDQLEQEIKISSTSEECAVESTGKKSYFCDICQRNFSSKTYLSKHIKLHQGDKPHQCDICFKSFALKDNLLKHINTHDPDKKRYFCLECGKGFTSRQYKEKHELIHLGEKPHVCQICQKAFTLKTNLNKHVLIHSQERLQHLCDTCGKGFSSKAYLEKHHLIHVGEKPHVCGICHKAFTLKTNLHKHYITHTGYRKFNCEICYKRFKTKGTLEQHYAVHTGEHQFKCLHCSHSFKQKAHLEKHMVTHADSLESEKTFSDLISFGEDVVSLHEVIVKSEESNYDFGDDKSDCISSEIVNDVNMYSDTCDNYSLLDNSKSYSSQTKKKKRPKISH